MLFERSCWEDLGAEVLGAVRHVCQKAPRSQQRAFAWLSCPSVSTVISLSKQISDHHAALGSFVVPNARDSVVHADGPFDMDSGLICWFLKIGDGSACNENQPIEYLEANSADFPPFLAVSLNLVISAFTLVFLGHLHTSISISVSISSLLRNNPPSSPISHVQFANS